MTQKCQHEGCFTDTTCALGHLERSKCEHWVVDKKEESELQPEKDSGDIPWNSRALGISDLVILAGRGRPIVVGIIGAPYAGKTTLLAYLYMWLLNKGELQGWMFNGSWTMGGWEALIQNCRWADKLPPSFPPHTSTSGRIPGLLHLSLRSETDGRCDVLLTDAPGEWFTQWSKAPNSKNATGARWVMRHSDVLLLLADSEAFSKATTRSRARRETRDLIERVGADAGDIPVGFMWTKADVDVPSQVRSTVERSRRQFMAGSENWQVTIEAPDKIAQVFGSAIDLGLSQRSHSVLREPQLSNDPFLAFRGHHAGS